MREKLRKTRSRSNPGKDVTLKVERSGLTANGAQRYVVTFRFYNSSEKKITNTGYAAADIDREVRRVYFVEADASEGWKMIGDRNVRTLSFTVTDKEEWAAYEGEYNLLKDSSTGEYYIDLK